MTGFTLSSLRALFAHASSGSIDASTWRAALFVAPTAALATLLGAWAAPRVSERAFESVAVALLLVCGIATPRSGRIGS